MMDPADLAHCREAIRHGSRSFHMASRLLPGRVRDPALALYAFCRLADDAVDLERDKAASVARLRARLDRAYLGTPIDHPADRAFSDMAAAVDLPRALPEALIEGFAWDAQGRRYASLAEVRAYSARVASTVGAMMCVLMGVRDPDALARACDLGVAMQLTNIARDVGEDAREGRLYLPTDGFARHGLDPEAFLADPRPGPQVAAMTRDLLAEADRLYIRAATGIRALPPDCRPAIFAARHIYAGIGRRVRSAAYDNVTRRARTGGVEKLGLMGLALADSLRVSALPRAARMHAAPLAETAFLVEAASHPRRIGRADRLVGAFAALESHRRATG